MVAPSRSKRSDAAQTARALGRDRGWLTVPVRVERKDNGHKSVRFWSKYGHLNGDAFSEAAYRELWASKEDAPGLGIYSPEVVEIEADTPEGERTLLDLNLPETPTFRSRRGIKFLFAAPEEPIVKGAGFLGDGTEVLHGKPLIIPPTPGYDWEPDLSLDDVPLAPIPPEVLKKLKPKARRVVAKKRTTATIPEGKRHETLLSIAGAMRRQGAEEAEIHAALTKANETRCDPPLPDAEIERLARDVPERYEPESQAEGRLYEATSEGFFRWKYDRAEKDWVRQRLSNWTARIVSQSEIDDGVETRREFDIQAQVGSKIRRFTIPARDFDSLGWVAERLGAEAITEPEFPAKYVVAAIRHTTGDIPERSVFAHTGWRKVNGLWVFLHSGGATGRHGAVPDIEVSLPESLRGFQLPDPPTGAELRRAVLASIRFLKTHKPEVTAAPYCAIWRAPLSDPGLTIWFLGETGVGKTTIALLAQQHYGADMTSEPPRPPSNWTSTVNSLEGLAFATKDVVLLVDDFKPLSHEKYSDRMQPAADRLLRSTANRSARGRMRPDGTLRPEKPPRGLLFSTGEDRPREKSAIARAIVVEVKESVDWDVISQCQEEAHLYAQVMSAYIAWIAPRYMKIRTQINREVAAIRKKLDRDHARTSTNEAELLVGLRYFLRFAKATGALSDDEVTKVEETCRLGVVKVGRQQSSLQAAADPVAQFPALLSSAISMGRAHVTSKNGDRPQDAQRWGWSKTEHSPKPSGDHLGWIDEERERLYLNPEAAYAIAERLARENNQPMNISQDVLWNRLDKASLLLRSDPRRTTVRQSLSGRRQRVLCVDPSFVGGEDQ
jgi:hypothetical protein